jgi:hypothetical protein
MDAGKLGGFETGRALAFTPRTDAILIPQPGEMIIPNGSNASDLDSVSAPWLEERFGEYVRPKEPKDADQKGKLEG